MPWLVHLVTSLSLQRPLYGRFMVDRVPLDRFFSKYFQVTLVIVILPVLHTHITSALYLYQKDKCPELC
jgi:hypothetical protein